MGVDVAAPAAVLADLRRSRLRHRVGELDWVDALYHAYLTALAVIAVILVLSGAVGDSRLAPSEVARVAERGPGVVGLVVALVVAVGLRSGGRGGPLALEAAEVRYVLLSPIPRGLALRGPALRQLRFGAFVGASAGAVAGELAARRLPGHVALWVLAGAVAGALAAAAGLGAGLVFSGRRLSRPLAAGVAVAILVWSGVDMVSGMATSPFTLLGGLAFSPLGFHATTLVGAAVALALAAIGVVGIGGVSLEAVERRAELVGQLRFAATMQDLRTVLLLRRQLSQERPRSRPWLRVGGPDHGEALPVWRRDWQGLVRWPPVRIVRVVVLGLLAGVSAWAAWTKATPLILVAGLALYVAGLEAVEPLAQEIDHPDRAAGFPLPTGSLHARHLPAAVAVMLVVAAIGVAGAVAVSSERALAVSVGLGCWVPAAALAAIGAASGTLMGSGGAASLGGILFPEAMGLALVVRTVWPPSLAVFGVLPVLAARGAVRAGAQPTPVALAAGVALLLVGALAVAWVRFRIEAGEWWEEVRNNTPGLGGGSQ